MSKPPRKTRNAKTTPSPRLSAARSLQRLKQPEGPLELRPEIFIDIKVTVIMTNTGDIYNNISNSTIINRSLLQGSLNKAQEIGGVDAAKMLEAIGKFVEQSGNSEAGELFDQFNEELQKPQSRKSVLRNAWGGLVKTLPTVTSIAGAVGAISKLFG